MIGGVQRANVRAASVLLQAPAESSAAGGVDGGTAFTAMKIVHLG